jgi:KDO2-lipid IV(A) lauroyltransferase
MTERTAPTPAPGGNAPPLPGGDGGVAYAPHRPLPRGNRLHRGLFRVQERATVLAYRFASWLLGVVPEPISWPLARAAFLAAYALWPAKRRIILANASHILGRPEDDPAVRRLAQRIFQTYARYVIELMRLPSRPLDEPARLVEADGERGFDAFVALHKRLRARGRGVIAVSIHMGSIETFVAAFGSRGLRTYGLADDTAYPELYALLQRQRRRWGVEVVGWRNMRSIIRALREAAILGLLVDWGYRPGDVPVRLFGAWTTLPAGPAVLAARTGAVIVPMVCRRLPDGHFQAAYMEPLEVPDDAPVTIARATQALADAVEAMVAPHPEQWYTFKRMWPPSGEQAELLAARAALVLREAPDG